MKLSAFLSLAALAQVSLADFYIFRVKAGNDYGYHISDSAEPGCRLPGQRNPWYPAKNDASGGNLGVRCNGSGCSESNVCSSCMDDSSYILTDVTRIHPTSMKWKCILATILPSTGVSSSIYTGRTAC